VARKKCANAEHAAGHRRSIGMAHDPTAEETRAFAAKYSLTEQQARRVLVDHGSDEHAWDDTVRSIIHFLRAPS
jgi:hypothetical protein